MSDLAALADRFQRFARHEAPGSSPLYERLCTDVVADEDVLSLLLEAPPAQRRPNLLLAAVHHVLLSGAAHRLADYYPSLGGSRAADADLVPTFRDFCQQHHGSLVELLQTRATQTNEVARSAMLVAAIQQLEVDLPVGLVDVGAAAGLNLLCDRYQISYGGRRTGPRNPRVIIECDVLGEADPSAGAITIGARVGIDPSPLSAGDPEDRQWLRACVWPEHTERRRVLDAALNVASDDPPEIIEGDAFDLPRALERLPEHVHPCVFHSATLAYLPGQERARFVALLDALGKDRALSWISLEGPFIPPFNQLHLHADDQPPDGAHLLLGLATWQNGERADRLLGRADPHGRWLQWLNM
jgi:hypothetical protein